MARLASIDEFLALRADAVASASAWSLPRVIIGMGTCGIAAGARDVMKSLMEEMAEADRPDIRVVTSGCMGMCSSEPNVTVEALDSEPIVYQHMDANRMRQVFRRHVLQGEVQTDFALAKL